MAARAQPSLLRRLRARLPPTWRAWRWSRPPWVILLLLAGDLVEIAASLALAIVSPPPAPAPRVPYPVLDLPRAAPALSTGVALIGLVAGVLMGLSLLGELYLLFRRAQIRRWRDRALKRPRAAALRA